MSICVHQQADGFNYLVITGDEALATPALVAANGGTVECGIVSDYEGLAYAMQS